MTNQEIINGIRESGKLETFGKEVKRNLFPQLSLQEIVDALEWGVSQGQVTPWQKSPIGNYVVKPLETVIEVSQPVAQVEESEEVEIEDEASSLFGDADISWTASNGSRIRVWTGNYRGSYHVAADAKFWTGKRIESVPAKFAAQARQNGVVAMLGPIGLTAERKAALATLDRSGLKSQPVG